VCASGQARHAELIELQVGAVKILRAEQEWFQWEASRIAVQKITLYRRTI